MAEIDITYDVRDDAGRGDPDTTSKRLREFHRLLWSKPLPDGRQLVFDTSNRRRYLYHQSDDVGELILSSDTVVPTWRVWVKMAPLIDQIPLPDLDSFQYLNHTIGGMMVFPGVPQPGSLTINGARGMNSKIADRFDLTLECIRRHYVGQPSPLEQTLHAYSTFFALFGDFRGYVEFFLLQDFVSADFVAVQLFTDFDDFKTPALPRTAIEYLGYREKAIKFIESRNHRISEWARTNLQDPTD